MLRRTLLFIHRDSAGEPQKLAMLRGLAFLRMECPGVRAGDYGSDLLGGSSPLRAVPPWKRTPRWRARRDGPACNYDVALHLDFEDEAAMGRCLADEAHRGVAAFNDSVTVPDLTACVDWRYEGAALVRRGLVRHTAVFVWAEGGGNGKRRPALDAARGLAAAPGVLALAVGEDLGREPSHFDWVLDVQCADLNAAQALLSAGVYAEAMGVIGAATRYEWTARVTHVMRGY